MSTFGFPLRALGRLIVIILSYILYRFLNFPYSVARQRERNKNQPTTNRNEKHIGEKVC